MIKFFQKLKAKKGFTLVELIVVIAIIGVLAAILVPTMLGYVTNSRVTSANSTAASIKNNIDTFLTNADTAGYGMKQGAAVLSEFDITITTASGITTWVVTAPSNATTAYKTGHATITWAAGSADKTTSKSGQTSAGTLLAIELCNLFPEVTSASIHVSLAGGKCVAVAYTADQNTALTAGTHYPVIQTTDGKWTPSFAWDTKTAGVTTDGIIVGTAPIAPLA